MFKTYNKPVEAMKLDSPKAVRFAAAWVGCDLILEGNKLAGIIKFVGKRTTLHVDRGDYLIRDKLGTFYCCKADQFESNYEGV